MSRQVKIGARTLAMENIRRKPVRSFVLILFILLFTFVLVLGSLVSRSLSSGIESLSNRLGADVMVVPAGYETGIDSVLLTGKPSEFYLPAGAIETLKTMEGIKNISPQTYIATLSSSCCSAPLQIIGIDYESDFIIKPWLKESLQTDLAFGQIIVGSNVNGEPGESLSFFGKPYKVVGALEKTGMGFDNTVFMTAQTAASLAKEAERKKKHPLSEDGSLISIVMLKLEPGYDSVEFANRITERFSDQGLFGMYSKKFVNTVSSNLSVVSSYIKLIIVAMWMLSVAVISLVFAMIFNERKKEMAILRVLGASKKKLASIILAEATILSAFASALGTAIALIVLLAGKPAIAERLQIPFLLPSIGTMSLIVLSCFLLGLIVGPLSSLFAVRKVNRYDIYSSLREE
ncbi:MAG: ABC transporter permease [Bacillota bacterium]|nr:ABC transporter permease [Bacillota bacterium]